MQRSMISDPKSTTSPEKQINSQSKSLSQQSEDQIADRVFWIKFVAKTYARLHVNYCARCHAQISDLLSHKPRSQIYSVTKRDPWSPIQSTSPEKHISDPFLQQFCHFYFTAMISLFRQSDNLQISDRGFQIKSTANSSLAGERPPVKWHRRPGGFG